MNPTRKSKVKLKTIAVVLIALILVTEIIPHIRANGDDDTPLSEYLYLMYPTNLNNSFLAKGECYLYAEVEKTDYITVKLDGEDFVLSYGINIFPIEFSESYEEHNILLPDISSTCIKSFAIEPLYLAVGDVNTTIDEDTDILFEAGGLVSLLVQPNFSYNWLYVEVNGIIYKKMYNTSDYPKIDSQFYSYFIDQGAYCRFDLNLNPGMHHLKLKGNGSIGYKIVVNSDWDEDQLSDVDEIQKLDFLGLDPISPNVWGFFQKSSGEVYWNSTEDPISEKKEGFFNFFIPKPGEYVLSINLYNGEVSDFIIDGNASIIENTLTANYPNTSINSISVNIESIGWHYVQYYFKPGLTKISFTLNSNEIKLLPPPELIDSDGDGVKDIEESNDLEGSYSEDTDKDGLPDQFDLSPDSSLTLNKDNITQLLIPTSLDKNSIISIQIKRPENDYSTDGVPRFWRGEINVSITAVLRLFGNQFQFYEGTPIMPLTKYNLTYLWGKEIKTYSLINDTHTDVGDALPPPSNPNNETIIINPIPTENCLEYQIKFPRNHAAKTDGILDLRFDIIWLVTSYTAENRTKILHYYDLEEDLTIQTINHREITDLYYTIGTPDDFVENQVLWALTQNQQLGSPEMYGVNQDIIGRGTVDYFAIGEAILNDVEEYYNNTYNQENETQVLYIAGLYETRNILSEISTKYDNESDTTLSDTTLQHYLSFYSVNDVYDDYKHGEEQLTGNSKLLFESYTNNFTSLLGLPIDIQVEVFPNAKVLTIIEALSEPIPNKDVPYSINADLGDNIILQNKTYIIRNRFGEPVPTIHFIQERDEYKEFTEELANHIESGKLFFENSSYRVSKFTVYNHYMNTLNITLGELHQGLEDFHTQPQYGDELFDIFRDFSDLLDVYVDTRGSYFVKLSGYDVNIKLDYLDGLIGAMNTFYKATKLVDEAIGIDLIFKDKLKDIVLNIGWIDKLITKLKNQLTKIYPTFIKLGTYLGNKIDSVLSFWLCKDPTASLLFRKDKSFEWQFSKDSKLRMEGAMNIVMGIGMMIWHVSQLVVLVQEGLEGKFLNETSTFIKELILSICSLALDNVMIITGVYKVLTGMGKYSFKFLESMTKYLGYVAIVISFALVVVDWIFFIQDVLGGKLTQSEFVIGLTFLIYETLLLIGLGIAAYASWTYVGAIIGGVIAAWALISALICPLLNDVNFHVHPNSGITLPDETKLRLRRHGGFEQGDILGFLLAGVIHGTNFVWARSTFRLEGDDWIGPWTDWQGEWGLARYWPTDEYIASFSSPILAPTIDIKFSLVFQLDFDQIVLLPAPPFVIWVRTSGSLNVITKSLDMPALENTISAFYNHTTEILHAEQLKLDYQLALDDYRYKDAINTADEIIARNEKQAKIALSQLGEIEDRRQGYNQTHFSFWAQDSIEFQRLIYYHFSEGFRAFILIPESERGSVSSDDIIFLHMISYEYSYGFIIFPIEWIDNKLEELEDAILYTEYKGLLPLATNIFLDLGGEIIDINPSTGKADVDLGFLLEGPDNPLVNITLKTSNEFIVTPGTFTQYLKSNLTFTIEDKDDILHAGMYLLNLSVFIGSTLIYRNNILFRIQAYSDLTLEINTPDGPINPGEILNLINMTNRGTVEEYIELKVEGVPEDFIFKDLYPEIYDNSIQYFTVLEGETRQCFVINPPRSFTSTPGEYFYTLTLKNIYTNETVYVYQGSFVVAEFYELEFQYSNPEITILDNETSNYPFTITNVGNIEDEFTITFADIEIASSYLGEDIFNLAPGQSQPLSIMLEPLDIGTEMLTITATSEHLSKNLIVSIHITDDDIDSPIFTIEAINCVSDEEPGYWRILAQDKSGIYQVHLTIDGASHNIYNQTDFGTGTEVEILIPISSRLGGHICEGYAYDADSDRGSIALSYFDRIRSIYSNASCFVIDDDLDPPRLSNLVIVNTEESISVSFGALDTSGIGKVRISIDNEYSITFYNLTSHISGDSYLFEIFNYWVNESGTHYVTVDVWDADEDRDWDSEHSQLTGIFPTRSGETPSIGISVIYGYSLFMLLGIICVIMKLLNSKHKKTQNKSPT